MKTVAIALCTRRRTALLGRALESVFSMNKPHDGWRVMMVVVDNDVEGKSASFVAEMNEARPEWLEQVHYCVEELVGIPHARNRAMGEAVRKGAGYLAFFDDDAVVDAAWLNSLINGMEAHGAQVVTGPQEGLLPDDAPAWAVEGNFYKGRRLPEGARCRWAATNNVLFDLRLFTQLSLRFDEKLKASGGSDQLFFMEAQARGFKIVWTNTAMVREPVQPQRLSLGWLMRRNLRYGSSGVYFHRKVQGWFIGTLLSLAKGAYYTSQGILAMLAAPVRGRVGFYKACCLLSRGFGWVCGCFGYIYPEYRQRPKQRRP